jgi:uroporphyrinogen decarboxylase
LVPPFEVRVIEEDQHTRTFVDADGITQEILKGVEPAMPRFLEFPVRTRQDFEHLLSRYESRDPSRYPDEWDVYKAQVKDRDYPLGLMFDGFFGRLRKWMGLENMLYTLMDDPSLFAAMCDFHAEFILETIGKAIEEIDVDYVNIWEDMAFKTGPLMSPRHVREYMLPGYRKLIDLLRGNGVDIIFVDSDGNLDLLIPIWLEAGINGVWPIEVAAGMDPVALRKQYGQDLLLVGGIDKRQLSKGKAEVYTEVMRRVPPLIEEGGYIPTVDHSVPPDVPLENYVYFRELLADLA